MNKILKLGNLGFKTVNNLKGGKKVAGVIKEAFQPVLDAAAEQRRKRLMDSLQKEYEKSARDRRRRT